MAGDGCYDAALENGHRMTDYFVEIQNQSAKLATHKLEPGKRYVVGRSQTAALRVEGDPYISR